MCVLLPIASIAFADGSEVGSIQHSNLAHGFVLTISGGSTPIFKQINMPQLNVFNLDLNLHGTFYQPPTPSSYQLAYYALPPSWSRSFHYDGD